MNRRTFLRHAGIGAGSLILGQKLLPGCKSSRKPNILFIAVDDLRPELGCYGNPMIHSPNIDKLAYMGVLFKNHYAQVPSCGPSRHCLLTGMFPKTADQTSNEVCRNYLSSQPESERPESFIHHLRRNGYHTAGIGKISHYADGLLYGYEDPVSTERELPYSWDELEFNPAKWRTGWNAFFGYADGENRQSRKRMVKPYEMGPADDKAYVDGYTADLAVNKLRELTKADKPFFLGVGFFKPHLPFTAPKTYWDMYNEDTIPLTEAPEIPAHTDKKSLFESGEFNGYLAGEEKASLDKPLSDAYARKLKHAYYACVSYVDTQIGKVLDELDAQGLADNTIVVVWGDHGWHLGDHRVWGKHTIFEKALKSALIIRDPRNRYRGEVVENVVSTVDLYPTLMALTGVAMPYRTDGKSLLPLLKNAGATWEDAAYGYYRKGITVRNKRYRLTRYFREEEPLIELYDHQTDPDETVNIAKEYPDIVDALMPLLERGNTGLYNHGSP